MIVSTKPKLVNRPVFQRWAVPVEVADFSADARPAYRVGCHCRNCNWKGEARVPVGVKIPLWLHCPKCETRELAARDDYKGRDEGSREEEAAAFKSWAEKLREASAGVL